MSQTVRTDAFGKRLNVGTVCSFAGKEQDGSITMNLGVIEKLGLDADGNEIMPGKVRVLRYRRATRDGKVDTRERRVWVETWKVARMIVKQSP